MKSQRHLAFLLPLFLIATCLARAGPEPTTRAANWAQPLVLPGITNLFQVTAHLYRGSQPTAEGMKQLKGDGGEDRH